MFFKQDVLKNFTKFRGKHLYWSIFFNKVAGLRSQALNFVKNETPTQVSSFEFCKIFENTFFTEHIRQLLPNRTSSSQYISVFLVKFFLFSNAVSITSDSSKLQATFLLFTFLHEGNLHTCKPLKQLLLKLSSGTNVLKRIYYPPNK